VAACDRLVLLGDVLELRERPLREALPEACPALRAIGGAAARGAATEIVLLAGNHDHRLIDPWLRRRDRARGLALDAEVPVAPGDPLGEIVAALSGSGDVEGGRGMGGGQVREASGGAGGVADGGPPRPRVHVRYPGIWLGEATWATHGHLGDRHTTVPILERLSAGVMARLAGAPDPRSVEDYEAALAPVYAWVDALAEHGRAERDLEGSEAAWLALSEPGGGLRRRAARAAFPVLIAALNRAGVGPLRADLSRTALLRGPLTAMGEVLARLGVGPRTVIFGHTHRAGPLPGEDPAEWRTPGGSRLLNTGCWVRERGLAGPDPARSPYRPGWAAWVADTGDGGRGPGSGRGASGAPAAEPELVNLLD
jgi:hypothetical protein